MLTGLIRIFVPALLLFFSVSLQAVSLKPDAPERYEVKQGDSLWSLAARYLEDPWMWPQLWQANPQVNNPHRLYPGDIIELLRYEGPGGQGVIRLKPRLRILTLQDPIPFMPLEQVESYLSLDLMVDRKEFEDSLYVSSIEGGRTFGAQGQEINVLGDLSPTQNHYGIYRDIEEIRDPLTQEVLGHLARSVGSARLVSNPEGYEASLQVTKAHQEVRIGDRLLPFQPLPFTDGFQPEPPLAPVQGKVVRPLSGPEGYISQYQSILLNQGEDQLQPGDLLQVLAPGRQRRDSARGQLIFAAENPRGLVMVYRVFENTSFGLVMNAQQPMQADDNFRKAPAPRL